MNFLYTRRASAATVAIAFTLGMYCSSLFAATNYVDLHGANIVPYDTWEKAATNIQSAVDEALDGNVVLVTDGWYAVSAQITIPHGIELRSVNGAATTTITRIGPAPHRLVHLGHGNARLNGFTLTNGVATGDGADRYGGGVLMVQGATIENCVISDNQASVFGGGISSGYDNGGVVRQCVITRNRAEYDGGGIFSYACTVQDSDIWDNYSGADGGGIHLGGGDGLVENCRIENNIAGRTGGGVFARGGDAVRNCLIRGNVASNDGGGVGYNMSAGYLSHCTILYNTAPTGGGMNGGTAENTILYYNIAQSGSNYSTGTFSHCCSTPQPDGTSNTPAIPQFLSASSFRLGPSSPCIDTGTDQYWMTPADYDLDGAPRIVHGAPDMGAYEYRESPLSVSKSGNVVLCLWSVLPDEAYRFERSTNLHSTHWTPIYEMYGGDSTNVEFIDYNTSGIGFYRAVYLPPE
jgi:hypothetical protein